MISRRVRICATRKDKDTYVSDMRICIAPEVRPDSKIFVAKRWVAAKCHAKSVSSGPLPGLV